MAKEEHNQADSSGSSEFAQMLREFTDLIRAIRASDLSASDRAKLRSLLDTLSELDTLTPLQAAENERNLD